MWCDNSVIAKYPDLSVSRQPGYVQTDTTLLANSSQHCCTPFSMLLRVVGSCCANFETGQTFGYERTQKLPTMLGVVGQQCCVCWHRA